MGANQKQPEEQRQPAEGLTREEMEAQEGAELPDREAMSLINANLAVPINAAIAANILSDNANAGAGATQQTPIQQGI
jgi:GH24 family phage-related lysozyme (muramidase)